MEMSGRIDILVNNGAVSPLSADVALFYIEKINEYKKLDKTKDCYEGFETHLVMALDRMIKGRPIEEFPDELENEENVTKFLELSVDTLKSVCDIYKIDFSINEAKFLSIYLTLLFKEG